MADLNTMRAGCACDVCSAIRLRLATYISGIAERAYSLSSWQDTAIDQAARADKAEDRLEIAKDEVYCLQERVNATLRYWGMAHNDDPIGRAILEGRLTEVQK